MDHKAKSRHDFWMKMARQGPASVQNEEKKSESLPIDVVSASVAPEQKKKRTKPEQDAVFYLVLESDKFGKRLGVFVVRTENAEKWIRDFKLHGRDDDWRELHGRVLSGESRLEALQSLGNVTRSEAKTLAKAHASALDVPYIEMSKR